MALRLVRVQQNLNSKYNTHSTCYTLVVPLLYPCCTLVVPLLYPDQPLAPMITGLL